MKVFLLLLPFLLFSGENEPVLPPSIYPAHEAYNVRVKKLREDFLKTVQAEQIKVLKLYEEEMKKFRLTKEEEALVEQIVKAEKEEVSKALMAAASQKVKDCLLLAGLKQRFLEEQAIMTDEMGNFYLPKDRGPDQDFFGDYSCSKKGEFSLKPGGKGTNVLKWSYTYGEKEKKESLVIVFTNGCTYVLTQRELDGSWKGSITEAKDKSTIGHAVTISKKKK